MPIYKLNGETYDIPNDVVADFEKDNPNATVTYFTNGDEYEIPVSERNGFLKEFPDATTEDITQGPGSTKQPMIDAMQKQASSAQQTPAPTQESKQPGYQPTAQELAGFQQTINNAGLTIESAVDSYKSKAANLQKRQGLNVPKRVNIGETNNLVEGDQQLNPDTGKLEQTYITSQGNKYQNKGQAENEQRLIDDYDRRMRYATGQAMDELSTKYVNPLVDEALKKADDEWIKSMKESSSVPMGEGMEMFALRRANEKVDPDKILQGLQKTLENAYKSPEMQKEISRLADSIGMSKDEYLEQIVAPSLADRLENTFASSQISKNMPKNATEYILQGLSNSIGGMLMSAATETKGHRNYMNQAEAMTEAGENPNYKPGTAASLAKMGVSFAADAPFFGVYGRVSGQVAKMIAQRQITKMMAKGLSEGAARSIVGSALENSVGARMKNYLMQHVVSSSLTLGAYNATSESARQLRDQEFNPGQVAKSTLEGLATGAAFGVTGGAVQALSQPLTGFARVGAKIGGFAAEAETLYATEELAKMAEGQEAFTNPFEGTIEAMEKLGVMKLSGGHLLGKAVETIGDIKNKGVSQVAGEAVGGLLGRQRTGVEFTPDEQSYIRDTVEGKDLVESLTNMHPDRAIEEVNGKKKFTKEGEQQRQMLAENYDRFMNNPEIPSTLKQKVAKMFGGIYRPGLETGAAITQNEDGSVILKTRDQNGNCVRDLKFDTYEEANAWQQQNMTEFSRNDATNMWNNASLQTRQKIVDIVKGDIAGTTLIADMMSQTGGMRQKRLQRELAKIEEVRQQFEGREMTDDEVRNYIQMVIKDGDDATFDQLYQIIRDQAYPADELNTKRNYWEGTQMSDMDRHYAQVKAQLAEERLRLQGDAFAEEVIGAADYPDEKMAELAMRASRGEITGDQLKAALDYYNKTSKVNGMMDEALKNIDNQVEAANAYIRKNTHTDSGSLIEGDYRGRSYYVTAGHFQISPDGKLVPTDNSGLVILRDKETGDIVTASPNDIQVTGIQDPNRIIEYNESMEGLRGELIKQADDSIELHPETPTEAANGDIYTGADGNQYMAIQIQDEAGNPVWAKIAIDEAGNLVGNPIPFDMEEYRKAKSNEIDAASRPQEENLSLENIQIEQNQAENAQNGENYAQNQPDNIQSSDLDNAGAEASAANGTGANEAPATALPRIPVDEKGRKLYEQAKPEDTLAELTEKYGEEKAQQMISQIADGAAKELEKLQQTDTSTITDMADLEAHEDKIAAAKAKVDYWNTISENIKNEKAKKTWENLENPKEIRNFATDPESQNQWVDEHFDEIVDSYSRTHGNKLDPDEVRKAFTGIGYTGKNVDEFRKNEVRLVRAIYEKMLKDAVESGNRSITLLTGAGGAGKSTATKQIDLSDRGVVYDSALNSFQNLERAILTAKNAGMTDIQVIAVYNDAVQSFSNTLKRGLESERFLPIGYFTKAFQNNQGKIAELRRRYPDVDIICFDNSGNKSAERPNGGRVSVEDAEKWDYTIDEEKFEELLKLIEDGINEGRFREDQLASIGRGLRDASRLIGGISPATESRIGQLVGRISGEDVGDMRPGISREQRESRRDDMAAPADGAVQGSSDQRGNAEEPGKKPGSSDDDGPEPPTAGAAAGGSGLGQSRQYASASGGSGAPATGGSGNGPASAESELSPAKKKVYQKAVEANIGRTFTFSYGNGTKSVLKVLRIDHNGNAVVTRQDYDAQGHPIGNPIEERYDFKKVGKAIAENTWKKELDTDEKLRSKYKFDKFKSGDVSVIDVLTDDEKQQILQAYERGDKTAVGNLTGDFIESHREDIILRSRALRNEKVDKAFARSGRGERLRGVREQYRGYPDAESYLTDEAMQPQTIEEFVADALGDVPKMGDGFLAYTSYDKGGNTIVGLKDETGFGSRGFAGDTKGFNPYLAPNGKGISLKQLAESIHESLPDGMKQQYSDQDLRNIIHSVMTSAEKPTDIANYILRNRVEQAEAAARHSENEAMDAPIFQKVADDQSFASRLQRSKESVNTEPTDGQKEAGNYKKGHISFGGYDFTIENPEGSVRRGTDSSGKAWEQKMNNTYGYILGKRGKDGDHLDMFINDKADLDNWNGNVYVVDQVDPKTGKFDEHKIMYGFNSEAEAREAYLSNYEKGWKGLGKITGVDKATFDKWLDSSDRKLKEFADHSIVKHKAERQMTNFDSALKDLNTRGISIDNQDLLDRYGLKNVVLSKTGDHIALTHFIVDQQGQGYGSRFMEDLARLADENGYTLALTPGLGFGAKSKKRLTDFYKRFGFVPNKGRNADFYTRESMIRRPKEFLENPENQEKVIRDAVVEYLKSKGIEVNTDWKLGQKILDDYNKNLEVNEEPEEAIKPQKVTDQTELDELNNGKTVKRYRAMQLIDGKLYPPMSAKVDGEMRQPTEIGVWEKAEERPDLIKNGKFVLNKGQKGQGNVPAAYNPYFHTSTSGLNDQFTSAYKRPELVVVEVEIPESELTSGYKAEGAKDAVGNVDWHSGVVNGQLPADRQRQVTLSRYSKVNRIVPDSEVADMIAKQLEGTNIEVPYNVVTPQLRKELETRGVKISDKPAGSVTEDINGNPIRQQKVEQPIFVSNAMRAVEGIKQDKATPEQWLKMIEKGGGLKAGEDKWLGLSDWLNEQKDKKSLTKQEVMDYIRQNQIEIEEQPYREYINLDDNPKMQEIRKEYDKLYNKYDKERNTVNDEMERFNLEMYEKYGQGWANDTSKLSDEDREKFDDLTNRYNILNNDDIEELAFREMVDEYGDDFSMAFEVNYGNGKLEPQMDMYGDDMSDAAKYYLDLKELPINSTRLDYTTDGLTNKKEIALTVPTIEPYKEGDQIHFGDAGGGRAVAWIRFGDTTDADGNRVLVIDEIQSKRHQEGREKGYKSTAIKELEEAYQKANDAFFEYEGELEKKYSDSNSGKPWWLNITAEEYNKREDLREARDKAMREYGIAKDATFGNGSVPDAPFDKNWHELAMKRMLRYAAENGYDKIAWTTGAQQAERYNIGNSIQKIHTFDPDDYAKDNGEFLNIQLDPTGDGEPFFINVDKDGKVMSSDMNELRDKNLGAIVGKELALKIMSAEPGSTIEGEGLRVGGEGMKGFYDQMLPRFMDKYGKKWGVKTGEVDLPMLEEPARKMHSIDVTPEMRESVMQGQPMFFKTPDGQAYGYTYRNKIYMDPRIATAETPIHEYGHLYCAMKRQTDPEGWNEWKQVMLNDEVAKPIIDRVKRDYPELAKAGKEDDFAEEIITQFSGKRGSERLREIAEEVAKEKGGIFGKAEAVTAMQRLKSILNRFWEGVAKMMGWKYTNANQIADKIMADMLNGVDPTKIAKDNSGKLSSQAEIERTLMGVHNLSEDKLRKVLKQGGLANPSLAVVDTKNHMHTDYGDISLIPKSSLIASSTGRNAGTFTADAWTPTYPQVQRLMSDKGQSLFWKDIRSLNDEAGEVANHMRMAFDTWLDKEVGQERLAYWYMKERGMNPELVLNKNPYGEDIVKRIDELTDNGNLEVSRLPEDQIREVADMYHAYKESIGEPVTPAKERIEKLQARIDPEKQSPFTKLQQYRLDELKKYGELLHNLNDFEYAVRRSAFSDGKPNVEATVDKAAKAVKDQDLQQDFEKWLQEKADRYGVEEKLWNGTDSQGRNRYLPNTLENASKLMKKEGLNGATNWSSIGNWIAKVANKEKTLGGIRNNKKNLNTSKEEHEAFHEEWGQKLRAIAEKLGKGDWWNGDNILGDALDHYKNISSYLKREYDYDLSAEDRQTIEQFVKEVQNNFPTGYFETKFERPVYLNEFEIAVVPESTSPEIVEALKNAGLDVRTYDNTGTEDQKDANRKQATMDAVSGRDDIMFQMVGEEGAQAADKIEGSDERSRNLTLAEDSEKAGVDSKAIKLATGWERGADGQWRYEIPDADRDILSIYQNEFKNIEKEYQEKKKELDALTSEWDKQGEKLLSQIEPDGKGMSRDEFNKRLEPISKKVKEMRQEVEHLGKLRDNLSPILKLGDLLGEDNELFKYYPEMKKMQVLFDKNMQDGVSGSFDGSNISINARETGRFGDHELDNENIYGTLLHEVQHAIQDIEGFAQGGNLQTSTTEAGINAIIEKKERQRADIKTRLDANNKILSDPENLKMSAELEGKTEKEVRDQLTEIVDQQAAEYDTLGLQIARLRHTKAPSMTDAKDLYHSLAGEVEARNVTDRMNMTDEERRNSLASETEDVPRENQVIIKGEGDESASMGDSSETFNESKKAQENENNSIKFQRTGNPEPEMTPEERQYWNQWTADMKKWRERYAIPEAATGPSEKPAYQRGESALDYAQKLVNWNRERSIWQTAPKLEDYRLKREDKDLLESARENEKRYPDSPSAKMRRVAAEFAQIRHAMSQQKAYDKATVKAVTDFAHEFMKLGFGDNLSRGEIERMLSSVKNATGSTDIKKNIDNIMNILMDNHLRNLENQVVKLSSTKELSKTAQGVEKQGKLELKGQRMIQAFREARQERMSVEDIRNRMAEVAEKMNRNDEDAPMWEQEYEGLSIALQYAENVEASRQEWAGLDQIYKDAVKDYKSSGRSYKAQQELLESIEQAMLENKIERIGMYGDVINRLEGNIAESMQGAKEFVEREKQRIKHIQDIANFDLAGKDMGAIHQSDWKKRLSNGSAARFFLSPLATFEQMLKQFGGRNANGEGYLYDHFMRSWIDSVDKSFVNEQKAKEELDAKAREVFGDKVKRWSDLYKLERTLPTAEVEIIDQGEPKTFTLNQGNLLYIYMADKMSDGRMKLRKMGIDEDKVQAIADFLDPRIKQLGDWLQGEYLPKKRTAYNKVHERMFGAPMAAIDNYFPIKILGDARIQEQDVANMADQDAVLPSTITGSIVKRRKNALPLDILGTDALSLAVEHIEDMERWAAQAEWNKDVNTLLSYTTFRNKVKNMNTIYGSGDQLWNTFADTARMAAGTYRPKAKPGSVDKTISNIAKGVTAAKINFRVYTAFKQILSAPAFLHDVNLGTFVKNSANPYGSWKWAMENMPVFQKRWKSRQVGDTRLMDDPTDWKMWKTNVVQMATRMGMSPNALVDGVTCAVGARSIYETRYKQYKDIGASDEVARKRAMQDAEIGYNLTQQSSEGAFVSAIQKDRTVAANMLSVFRNSSMAYTRQWVDAARNLKRRGLNGYKEDSIRFMAGQLEERFGLEPDQAKKVAESQYARAARHDVARLLNMMFGVTTAWNLGASLPYLLFGDDDHTKAEMLGDALVKGLYAGPTEGLAAGNIYSDLIGRTIASGQTRKTIYNEGWGAGIDAAMKQAGDYEVNPLPLMADIQSMIKKMGYDKYAAAQDVFNICMQSAVGVNPQTFTDMWNACMDYGNPEWMPFTNGEGNNDLANSKEIALFIMRLMNAPTSSWRNKYIDELGMNAEDAKKLPYEEMARRYANYKHWKDAPIMGWLRDDESRADKMKKIQKQFDNAVVERMERLTDEELKHNVMRSESAEERRKYAKIIANRLGVAPGATSQKPGEDKWYQEVYQEQMQYDDIREDEMLATKLREYREKDNQDNTKKEVNKRLEWIRNGKYDTPSGRKGNRKKGNEPELLAPGKSQFNTNGDEKANEAIMQNIRKWRKEALEILMRAEAE